MCRSHNNVIMYYVQCASIVNTNYILHIVQYSVAHGHSMCRIEPDVSSLKYIPSIQLLYT